MNIPGLPEEGDRLCAGIDQTLDIGILLRLCPCSAGAAKGYDRCVRKGDPSDFLEKLKVFRVGSRPASFNIMDP